MVGMAVTDAFGHWFEFLPAVPSLATQLLLVLKMCQKVDKAFSSGHGFSLEKFLDLEQPGEAAFQRPNNTFSLQLGQWTDDCSMGAASQSVDCEKTD